MLVDDTYIARRLQLLGDWDAALAVLAPDTNPELRAEIAVERWFFQMSRHDEAEQAVAVLDQDSPAARVLRGRLAYSRLFFGREPRPDDRADAEAAYRAAVRDGDEDTRGWAEFHWGVLLDNVDRDPAAALPHYEAALEAAEKNRDGILEAMTIRHMTGYKEPAERIRMFRRSLHLRSALGVRHQVLAAQASLAQELPEGDPEREALTEAYLAGAAELGIAWLLSGRTGTSEDFES